ncbi:hypothetical protein F2P81_015818 [Scophthalmus maximus]|uniref:Uncharacterized protein n=1 Tax=Scophthalmus maximus TaxID=52904 RepID=A0A6A4SAJ9_SCOMX|nr:hypothetical protein F2P81_015818 [Scophthalmus maximus]
MCLTQSQRKTLSDYHEKSKNLLDLPWKQDRTVLMLALTVDLIVSTYLTLDLTQDYLTVFWDLRSGLLFSGFRRDSGPDGSRFGTRRRTYNLGPLIKYFRLVKQ